MSIDVPLPQGQDDADLGRHLFIALSTLMETMPLDKITVSDIVTTAHVSRTSFYRRYQDKYDLLNATYELILQETLFSVNRGTSWRDAIHKIYAVIQRNAGFFKGAFASNDHNSLRNYIFERTLRLETEILERHGVDVTSADVAYRLRAYVAGGLQLTVDWVGEGATFPLGSLVDILVEMVPEPFRPFFL